jgi:hypothetical protein
MSRTLLTIIAAVVFSSLPAWAADDHLGSKGGLFPFGELDLNKAQRFLEQIYKSGADLLAEHVEVEGTWRPSSGSGEQSGRLKLKLYPKGKTRSEESLNAETWFRFEPKDHHLHFDFKFFQQPPSQPFTPEDYI